MKTPSLPQEIVNKLIINALEELNDRYGNDGCNDLAGLEDEPLFKGLTISNMNVLYEDFKQNHSKLALETDNEMLFNTTIIHYLIEKLKKN